MAIKSKTFTLLAFIFAVTCLVSLIVAFASDRWFVSSEKEVSGFNNIGLWSACFSRYRPPAWALVDKYYDGCWWVFDREMDDLRQFLFPSWLVGTQVLVTISLTFQLIAMIIMIVNAINCFPYNRFKDVISIGLALASVALHGFTAILLIVAVILFGARADNDRTWIQKPDQNYLSWSFGLCVLAAFVSILTFMTVSVEVHRLRLLRRGGSDPEGFLTNVPPPPTFYAYSKQKFQLSNTGTTDSEKSQPAYANRYGNQDSSGRPRPPNTMFAVSGAGDVYLNRAYMNEGNLQRGRLNGYEPPYERRQLNPPQNQVRRPPDSRVYTDDVDSQRLQNMNSAAKSGESENITSKKGADTNNDYEEAKKIRQPVLPEYVPKLKSENVKKIKLDNTLDESCDTDIPKKKEQDSGDESRERKRTRSNSKSKKSTRSRSNSKTKSKEKKDADNKHSKRRSKSGVAKVITLIKMFLEAAIIPRKEPLHGKKGAILVEVLLGT